MDFGLGGRVALVTGGGRGIGRAVATALAGQGADVAICGRTRETLEEAAAAIAAAHGVRVWPIVADVTRLGDIQDFVRQASDAAGRIDILVNNAVSSLAAPFEEQTDDHWRHHIDVKLMAYIRCAREVMAHMEARRWGRIVNIAGMTARIVAPLRITNGVVNAGVSNFTKQLSGQVARHNVTVNCIHPGYTTTERMTAAFERRAQDAGVSVQIAAIEGNATARMIGYALAALSASDREVPWQRVLNRTGAPSERSGGGGTSRQRRALEAEGVLFDAQGHIDFDTFGWDGPDIDWMERHGFQPAPRPRSAARRRRS